MYYIYQILSLRNIYKKGKHCNKSHLRGAFKKLIESSWRSSASSTKFDGDVTPSQHILHPRPHTSPNDGPAARDHCCRSPPFGCSGIAPAQQWPHRRPEIAFHTVVSSCGEEEEVTGCQVGGIRQMRQNVVAQSSRMCHRLMLNEQVHCCGANAPPWTASCNFIRRSW